MHAEGILIPELHNPADTSLLNLLRETTRNICEAQKVFPPGMLTCASVTLLKTAACLELSQRFIVDWIRKNADSDQVLNLVMLDSGVEGINHMIVLIGDIQCDDALLVGRGDKPAQIAEPSAHMSINDFFAKQPFDMIYADPLLVEADFVGWRNSGKLGSYCAERGINRVIGVRQMSALLSRSDKQTFAQELFDEAAAIARLIHKQTLNIMINLLTGWLLNKGDYRWIYNGDNDSFCLKGDETFLRELQTEFGDKGLGEGLQLTKTALGGQPMLVFENVSRMELLKVHLVYRAEQAQHTTAIEKKPANRASTN